MKPWRLLIVDENDDFLDGLASWIVKQRALEVAGRAHGGQEAVERVRELSPDLVLMDVSLGEMSGFEATALIKAIRPTPKVLLMSFHESRAAVIAAFASGADGCISKSGVTDGLSQTIETLLESEPERSPVAVERPRWNKRQGGDDGTEP